MAKHETTAFATYYEGRVERSLLAALSDFGPSLTQQHFKDECDINNIMAAYVQTGLLPAGTAKTGSYEDFTTATDYLEAMLLLQNARNQFDQLPLKTRIRFEHDPSNMLQFIEDPANRAEAQTLGLLNPEKPAETENTPPVPPAPPKA